MIDENVKLFKALGSDTRYLIVKALLTHERCACELPGLIGRTQSNTSMQLSKLLEAGILTYKRDGKKMIYSIKNKKVISIFKLLEQRR